ncbi:Ribose 5-phosphate isomerase, type A [Artemisia annua]|uniref:ribose-5-phosphate isomerase n=1 Tax=Artemisia annua TaxID=35608 RepID=A0A2U1MHK0_ARTAN|nr:Ribose 5-phosphate isomerase, type A [Artemisia annua]
MENKMPDLNLNLKLHDENVHGYLSLLRNLLLASFMLLLFSDIFCGCVIRYKLVKPEIISWSPRIIVFHNVLCIELKYLRSDQLVEYVSSGMVLGLGTGSTAAFVVYKIGQLLASGQLTNIIGVPTSKRTQEQAAALGITLSILGDHPKLDLAIDGANEVDPNLNLVKGRGGALLREKMVEAASNKCVVVVDDSKLVIGLGGSGLAMPVQVVQFCWK